MSILNILNRHARMAAQANPYADGELRGAALERFERHLPECQRCTASVAAARELKTMLRAMPAASAPRSFVLTPAMVGSAAPERAPARAGTPLYLGLARAGAALSVAAFGTVLAFGAIDSETSNDGATNTADRDLQLADAASGYAPESAGQPTDEAFSTSAATATPMLAPAATGGAGGAGLASPVPPMTGLATPDPNAQRSTDDGALAPAASPQPGGDSSIKVDPGAGGGMGGEISHAPLIAGEDGDQGNRGSQSTALWFGAIAGAMVVLVAGLEVTRRVRR